MLGGHPVAAPVLKTPPPTRRSTPVSGQLGGGVEVLVFPGFGGLGQVLM